MGRNLILWDRVLLSVPNGLHKHDMENAINIANKKNVPFKVPILKITINKKYNKRFIPYPGCWAQTNSTENVNSDNDLKLNNMCKNAKFNLTEAKKDINAQKPVAHNDINSRSEKHTKWRIANVKPRDDLEVLKRTWKRKGDLSRENVRNQTNAERLRHLNTKAQRELEILTIRLKALKERYKFEKKEIAKLNKYLSLHWKDIPIEPVNEITNNQVKTEGICTNFVKSENEDEYEKMLREVRKMKQMLEETPVMRALHDRCKESEQIGSYAQTNNVKNVYNLKNKEVIRPIRDNTRTFYENVYTDMRLTTEHNENAIEIKAKCIDCTNK